MASGFSTQAPTLIIALTPLTLTLAVAHPHPYPYPYR